MSLALPRTRLDLSSATDEPSHAGISLISRQLIAVGLTDCAAGALLMPYTAFRDAAEDVMTDIDRLGRRLATSLEQTCRRLSTSQRPSSLGVPLFLPDRPGSNITKHHSATQLQFACFGTADLV